MKLTSATHRRLASTLRTNAAALPPDQKLRADEMRKYADMHCMLARVQEENPSLAPKPIGFPREQLSYRHMTRLADVMEGWALDKRMAPTPEKSRKVMDWANSLRALAQEVGVDWDPPQPAKLSSLGLLARWACDER